jgi:hypothetical protein
MKLKMLIKLTVLYSNHQSIKLKLYYLFLVFGHALYFQTISFILRQSKRIQ